MLPTRILKKSVVQAMKSKFEERDSNNGLEGQSKLERFAPTSVCPSVMNVST